MTSNIKLQGLLVLSLLAFSTSVLSHTAPFVDGKCNEYNNLQIKPIMLSEHVSWYIYEDHSYVWFCFAYPKTGFGTMDLKIETAKLGEVINLHSSAQLGEWPVIKPDLAPKTPSSERWWNNNGWVASCNRFNGFQDSSEENIKFRSPDALELQFSKERFGSGEWKIHQLTISHIKKESFPNTGAEPLRITVH